MRLSPMFITLLAIGALTVGGTVYSVTMGTRDVINTVNNSDNDIDWHQSEPAQWCSDYCEGHVDAYYPASHRFAVTCNDGGFVSSDKPQLCEMHGGVHDRTDLGNPNNRCFCSNGLLKESP